MMTFGAAGNDALDPQITLKVTEIMLKLYYAPGACSFVAHAALEIAKASAGAQFEPALLNLRQGEQHTPEYRALNPNSQVPLLLVDGKPLAQIVAIADYLDRTFPAAQLMPADPWARAQALSTLAWMNNSVHPTFTHIFRPEKFVEGEAAIAEVKRFNVIAFRGILERIQEMTKSANPWLFGDNLTFADLYALVFLRWGSMAGIDPDTLPAYKAFQAKVSAHPAVAAAIAREGIKLDMTKRD